MPQPEPGKAITTAESPSTGGLATAPRKDKTMNKTVTISISVGIASASEWEGNAEFAITIPENHLKYIDRNKLADELDHLIENAINEYKERNK